MVETGTPHPFKSSRQPERLVPPADVRINAAIARITSSLSPNSPLHPELDHPVASRSATIEDDGENRLVVDHEGYWFIYSPEIRMPLKLEGQKPSVDDLLLVHAQMVNFGLSVLPDDDKSPHWNKKRQDGIDGLREFIKTPDVRKRLAQDFAARLETKAQELETVAA